MNDDIEYFAPWAVTKDNAQEALTNASDLLIRWREDSDRDGQWAEDTDEIVDQVHQLIDAVLSALKS